MVWTTLAVPLAEVPRPALDVVRAVNGAPPENYVLFYADPKQSRVDTLEHFLTKEMRSRYYNPEWIRGMMKEGYSGADQISVMVANTMGWEVVREGSITQETWAEIESVFVRDKLNLSIETDGTLDPLEACREAVSILVDHLSLLKDIQYEA